MAKQPGWQEGMGNTFQVRVTPKASRNAIKADTNPDGSKLVRVYVTAAPEDGKANDAVIVLLAKELGISRSSLTITHGLTSRNKIIRIERR